MKPTKKSYDDSCSRPNEIMKTPALRKSKYYINTGSFRHNNNCGSTHPSMTAWEENILPPSFSGLKSQKILHEFSCDGVSGTDNDEQSLKKTLASVFHLCRLLEAFSWFQNDSILLVNASCKRGALIMEDEFENTYFNLLIIVNRVISNRLVTI